MALRNQEIGARLRELRGQKPQTTVADELGVAERTYQNWEAGDAKPSYRNLQRLAEYYGVGEEFILAGEGDGVEAPRPARTPNLSRTSAEDVLTQLLAAVTKQNGLLDRQSAILERIEARLDAAGEVRDELSDLIDRRAREIVEGSPASEPGPPPTPRPTGAGRKPRAASQRTP